MGGDTPGFFAEKIRSVPLVARSATKRERGACPRKGRQPRRSGCAVRPRRTTEHGAGVLAVRRAGRRESDKGLAVRSLAAGAGRQQGCLFCCDKRSPGCVGRARRSLVRRTDLYASVLAPALARLASGLPCLATKPFRGPAPCSGARMPRDLRDGALAPDSAIRLPDPPRHAGHFASPRCAGPAASLRSSAVRVYAWANPATKRASRGTRRNRRKSPKPKSGDDAGRRFS